MAVTCKKLHVTPHVTPPCHSYNACRVECNVLLILKLHRKLHLKLHRVTTRAEFGVEIEKLISQLTSQLTSQQLQCVQSFTLKTVGHRKMCSTLCPTLMSNHSYNACRVECNVLLKLKIHRTLHLKITPSYNASRRARASPNISRDFQRGRKTTFIWEFFLLPRARDICVQRIHCSHNPTIHPANIKSKKIMYLLLS